MSYLLLLIFPAAIGANLHFYLNGRPKNFDSVISTYVIYGCGCFLASLFIKFVQGWDYLDWQEAFSTVKNLFKFGVVETICAFFIPLALSFVIPTIDKFAHSSTQSIKEESNASKQ